MSRFFRPLFLIFGVVLLTLTLLRALQPSETSGFYITIYGSDTIEECCNVYMLHPGTRIAHRVRLKLASVSESGSPVSPSGLWTTSYVRLPPNPGMYLVEVIEDAENAEDVEGEAPRPKMIPLPNLIAQSQVVRWALLEDTLFYLEHQPGGLASALYSISPPNPAMIPDLPPPTPDPNPPTATPTPTPTPIPTPTLIPPNPATSTGPSLVFPPPAPQRTSVPTLPYAKPERRTPFMFRYVHALNEYSLPETHFSPYLLLFWNANLLFVTGAWYYRNSKNKKNE